MENATINRERTEVSIGTAELQSVVAIQGKALRAADVGDIAGHDDRPSAGPVKLEGVIDGQNSQIIRDHRHADAILNELVLQRRKVDSGASQCLGGGRRTTGKLQLLDCKLATQVVGCRERRIAIKHENCIGRVQHGCHGRPAAIGPTRRRPDPAVRIRPIVHLRAGVGQHKIGGAEHTQ